MHQDWIQHRHTVITTNDGSNGNHNISPLNLDELESMVPGAKSLLQTTVSKPQYQQPCPANTEILAPAPHNGDPLLPILWGSSDDGDVSSAGCFPLALCPTRKQYDDIVAIQAHLRDLGMLQILGSREIRNAVQQLKRLRIDRKYRSLLLALIHGLTDGTVVVHKGLASGFTVPEASAEFWGVSDYRVAAGIVDIFISRNCPGDTSTILHTWLAQYGISREERYEAELLLEGEGIGLRLPVSMWTAIKTSTPSEVLLLLRRAQASTPKHPFIPAIKESCKAVLVYDTDLEATNAATSSGFLSGAVSMHELLSRQLSGYSAQGIKLFPLIDSLIELYGRIEGFIQQALLNGDREAINGLTSVIHHAFQAGASGMKCIDMNTDMVLLMYFCALRKAALEDVYMEATDHCPLFSRPDQAAVFSELWVLGSQCELYFCMKPRALGQIIYDRHRDFLKKHPPPTLESLVGNGFALERPMSVYAKAEHTKGAATKSPKYQTIHSYWRDMVNRTSARVISFGALSVFCLPAVVDLFLLTFLGRGLFMTAYMGDDKLIACCYALLVSLLISAGVTGWVGSIGNYYLSNVGHTSLSPMA